MSSIIKCDDSAGLTQWLSGKVSFFTTFDWEKVAENFKSDLELNIFENPNSIPW